MTPRQAAFACRSSFERLIRSVLATGGNIVANPGGAPRIHTLRPPAALAESCRYPAIVPAGGPARALRPDRLRERALAGKQDSTRPPQRRRAADSGTEERRHGLQPGGVPRFRLRHDGYVADIIDDRRGRRPLVHCVIQKEGSPEILFYTQFTSAEAAQRWAQEELEIYSQEQRRKA